MIITIFIRTCVIIITPKVCIQGVAQKSWFLNFPACHLGHQALVQGPIWATLVHLGHFGPFWATLGLLGHFADDCWRGGGEGGSENPKFGWRNMWTMIGLNHCLTPLHFLSFAIILVPSELWLLQWPRWQLGNGQCGQQARTREVIKVSVFPTVICAHLVGFTNRSRGLKSSKLNIFLWWPNTKKSHKMSIQYGSARWVLKWIGGVFSSSQFTYQLLVCQCASKTRCGGSQKRRNK